MEPGQGQWRAREGYGGPESFPEDGVAGYALAPSAALGGRQLELHLADGRVLEYGFHDAATLTARQRGGEAESRAEKVAYQAVEAAGGIFFLHHEYPHSERAATVLILDLNRQQTVVVDAVIPADGEADYRVRRSHVGGCIGTPRTSASRLGPPAPTDLVGKRFVADYGERYAWEVIYLNDHRVAWHGLRGNPGIGDVEVYTASQFAPGVYAVSWSEEAETLFAAFLYNIPAGTITGYMFGFAPAGRRVMRIPLGGRIVDSREYGVGLGSTGADGVSVQQKNKDLVLRQHYEIWNQARYDLVDEIYGSDFTAHFVDGLELNGRDALRAFVAGHRRSFPDWTERVVDIFAEGDRVVSRYHSTGTHAGEFQGIAATGRAVSIPEVSVYRVHNGRIVEQWGFPDGVALMHQLGQR